MSGLCARRRAESRNCVEKLEAPIIEVEAAVNAAEHVIGRDVFIEAEVIE
jgi:hypothetical protein